MPGGLIDQLVLLVLTTWGTCHTPEEIREHLLEVMEAKTYCVVVSGPEVIGYLEWRWITPETLRVTELITKRPGVIWTLRRQLNALPWMAVQFRRHRGQRERTHTRRLIHV